MFGVKLSIEKLRKLFYTVVLQKNSAFRLSELQFLKYAFNSKSLYPAKSNVRPGGAYFEEQGAESKTPRRRRCTIWVDGGPNRWLPLFAARIYLSGSYNQRI